MLGDVDADSTIFIHAVGYAPEHAPPQRPGRKRDDLLDIALFVTFRDVFNTGFGILANVRSAFNLCQVLSSFMLASSVVFDILPLILRLDSPHLIFTDSLFLFSRRYVALADLSFSHFDFRSASMP
jgi:hypothetical protein